MLVPPSGDRDLVDIKPSFLCSRLHHRGEAKKESAFLQKRKGRILVAGSLSPFDSDPLSVSPSLDPFSLGQRIISHVFGFFRTSAKICPCFMFPQL